MAVKKTDVVARLTEAEEADFKDTEAGWSVSYEHGDLRDPGPRLRFR